MGDVEYVALFLAAGLRLALGGRLGDHAVDLRAQGGDVDGDADVPPARHEAGLVVPAIGPAVADADEHAAGPLVGVAERGGRLVAEPERELVAVTTVDADAAPDGAELDRRGHERVSRNRGGRLYRPGQRIR
ncbi:hypothetical protein ACFQE0_26785 [Methylobacterium komagatae]|uniref:Uncharacterized protein n=1 Tax=Methylobacterium komagatae TaxID=374425 RepID=A0ABW2BQY9_9HYPH